MNAFPIGRIYGLPIFANWSAVLILGFLVWSRAGSSHAELAQALLSGLIFFGSILVHELGHAFAGRRLGLAPQSILIHGFGGLCTYGRSPKAKEGLISAAAGPGAGLALGFLCLGLHAVLPDSVPRPLTQLLGDAIFFNLFWSVFNLLPMYPMDGGMALWHGLRMKQPGGRAWRWTRNVSITTCILVAIGGYLIGQTFMVIVAALVLMQNLQSD